MSDFISTELTIDDLTESMTTPLRLNNRNVVLTLLDGRVYAFMGLCPHAAGDLTRSDIRRGQIICPMHYWKFDIRTGRCTNPPDEASRLKRYEVDVSDAGEISVKLG